MPERSPIHAALGLAIREMREKKKLSQEQLADAAGVHVTYLSGVEPGRRNPTWTVLVSISDALGVAPSRLAKLAEQQRER